MALGKGLNSLIPQKKIEPKVEEKNNLPMDKSERVWQIPLSEIVPNPHQPRKHFEPSDLADLVSSIKAHGVMQPITVTERPDGGYELIAGERRFRASTEAGLATIPALVRVAGEQDKLELALIENIQRQQLNAVEEAFSFKRLIDEFGLTQQQVADQVGKSRSAVANTIRLLELPEIIKEALVEGKLSAGKARALLSLNSEEEQLAMFQGLLDKNMNVRQVEAAVSQKSGKKRQKKADPNVKHQEKLLEDRLGTKVKINNQKSGKGTITISYFSKEELRRILADLV